MGGGSMKIKKIVLISAIFFSSNLFNILPALSQCAISVTGVKFGSYSGLKTTAVTSTGSINYDCSGVIPVPKSITINLSRGNAPTYKPRQLRNGNDLLNYNLYLDPSGQFVWGDGTTNSQNYVSPSLKNTVPIYGIVPAGQKAKMVGEYTDPITVTVGF